MKKILLFLFLLSVNFLYSQTTFSWRNDQNPTSGQWNVTNFWWNGSDAALPGGAEILFLDGNVGVTMTNDLPSTNRYRISFGSTSAASRTINGSTTNIFYDYTNNIPAIFNGSGVTHTINFPFQIGNTSTSTSPNYGMEINASSGALTFGSTISAQNATGTKVLVLRASSGGTGTITLNGVISDGSGTVSLSKIESNIAILGALNTYTGSTTITGGTLRANINQSGSSGPFGNNSSVRIGASGSLDLNGFNATVASVAENGTSDGGTIALGGGTLTISGGYGGTLFQNSISGSNGSIIKNGTGVLSLYGSQTYTGSTTVNGGEISSAVSMASTSYTINGGTFRIAAANIIPDNANFTVSSGTLQVDQNETISNLNLTGGTLNIASGKTLTINGTFTGGGTIVNNGKLVLKGTATFPGATTNITTMNDLEIYRNPSITLDKDITVSGSLFMALGNLNLGGTTLTIDGTITWNSSLTRFIGSSSSNLIINGSGALGSSLYFDQTSDGSSNLLNSLTINRTSSGSVTLADKIIIANTLTVSNGTLTTAGYLHLRSNSSGTARVAAITGTGAISGNVTVERYIPGNRKWRSLSVPLIGSSNNTIYNNWQNNGTPAGSTGVELWKPGANTATDGFTAAGGTANILTYTGGNSGSGSGGYTPVSNTKTQVLFDATGPKPFLVYATGPYGSSNVTSGFAETTLKATGTLVQGSGNFGYTGMATGYWFVTNPYPSAIDFASIGKTNVNNIIYMWDPLLTGMNGQGNYQTTNDGTTVPQGGSYSGNSTIIPNGASFFVYSTGSGSLSFSESNKVTGDFNVFGRGNANGQEVFRANILIPSTTDVLNDGVATVFGASYSSTPSNEDAVKFNSPTNGIAIRRANNNYAIELRPYITSNDTMFLRLLNMNQTNYKLELKAEYFDANSGLEAFLKDTYTNTTTPVSLTADTYYNFTVDANAASTGDRFMVVFRNTNPLPVKITSIKATQKATTVVVDWTVENEVNIASYEVQKSTDGRNFETLNTVNANNSKAYNSIDNAPSQAANYYRVVIIGNDDKKQYSNIVLVKFGVKNSEVAIYPNPLKGNTINLQLQNIDKGDYELQIINIIGQVLYSKVIQHNGGSATQTVQLPSNVAKGNYVLKLANKEAIIYSEKIILE